MFGLTHSLFILEASLKANFYNYLTNYSNVIKKVSDNMYIDDLASGGYTVGKVEILKQNCEELFKKSGFNLHKQIPKRLPRMSLLMKRKRFKPVQMKLKY